MRIIIANDTYYPNVDGCSYFSQRLAKGLKSRGHEVLVIAPGQSWHTKKFSHDGIDIFGLYSVPILIHKNYRFTPPLFIKNAIEKAIKEFKPDIIHIQGHFCVGRAAMECGRKLGIPVMGTNHFMPENLIHYGHFPEFINRTVIKFMWNDFKKVFEELALDTTPTKTAAKLLQKIGFKKSVMPVSCGIDTQKFNPNNNGEYLRKKLDFPNKSLLICVGRLAKEKNIDFILRALALVPKKIAIHLVVVGDGPEKENLKKLAYDLGVSDKVTFTGFVADIDLPNLYAISSAFVMAGSVELQSLVTMEAMASGLPVLAANALALPELVHNNDNGFLFELDDPYKLADYIEIIFSDENLRKRMGERSRGIAEEHDIAKSLDRFEELYRSLLKA